MAAAPAIELELDYIVWTDSSGTEQTTPAHPLPSGTQQLFWQSSAPAGWTKITTENNKALRVVSGSVSSGGNKPFNAVMGTHSFSTSHFALNSTAHMPSHRHYIVARSNKNHSSGSAANAYSSNNYPARYQYTNYEGGGGSHSHSASLDLQVQYIDVIIARKD